MQDPVASTSFIAISMTFLVCGILLFEDFKKKHQTNRHDSIFMIVIILSAMFLRILFLEYFQWSNQFDEISEQVLALAGLSFIYYIKPIDA